MTKRRQSSIGDTLRAVCGHEILFEHDGLDAAVICDLGDETGQQVGVASRREDLHALGRQGFGDGAAQALAGPGHECGLAAELEVHGIVLP
ncbi:hypothetical protein D3C85_1470910 [compost metagenome]